MKEKMHIAVVSLCIFTLIGVTFAVSSKNYKEKDLRLNSASTQSGKFVCSTSAVSDSSQVTKEYNKNIAKLKKLLDKLESLGGDTVTLEDPCVLLKGKAKTECNINNVELRGLLKQVQILQEKLAPYETCKKTKTMSGEITVSHGILKNKEKEENVYPSIQDGFPWGKDVRLSSVPGPLVAYTIVAPNNSAVSSIEIIFDIKIPEKYKGLLEFEKAELRREDNQTEITQSKECSMQKTSFGYHVSCKGEDVDVIDSGVSAWYSVYVFPSKITGNGEVGIDFIDFKYRGGSKYNDSTKNLSLSFVNDPRPTIITDETIVHVNNNGNIGTLGTFTVYAPINNIPISITVVPFQATRTLGGSGFFSNLSLTDGVKNFQCGYYLEQKEQPICENLSFDAIQSGGSKTFTLKGKIENAKPGEGYIIHVSGLGFNKDIPNNPIINDGRLQIIVD